jgi:germination protein M
MRTPRARTGVRLPLCNTRSLLATAALSAALALTLAVALTLAACGNPTPQAVVTATVTASPSANAPASASPTGAVTLTPILSEKTVAVYFLCPIGGAQPLHGPFIATAHRTVAATPAVATAAVNAMLVGPSARERALGMTSDVPAGTTLRGIRIAAGVATVDLSSAFAAADTKAAMTARLAQVVYTLTQFPSVKGVLLKVDGAALTTFGATGISLSHPQRRSDYETVTPPIFVESPAPFDAVAGTLHVSGTADVFEATFRARLVVGSVAKALTVTASSGSGTRGVFAFSLPLPGAGVAKLVVWDASAENGAALHTVTIPLVAK